MGEESFKLATVGDVDINKIGDDSAEISASSDLESWDVKIEQSINSFLPPSCLFCICMESFGWWRRVDYLKVYLLRAGMKYIICLFWRGNSWWFDRFLAQNIAFFYYIMTAVMYAVTLRMAYHFSECVESHVFSTYDKFLKAQGEELKKLPAPEVAVKTGDDLYLFDEFQTSRPPQSQRPKIENLYAVFLNIRDDEMEHCKTMRACQMHGNPRSPHSSEGEDALEDDPGGVLPQAADCEGIEDCIKISVTSSPQRDKASAKY